MGVYDFMERWKGEFLVYYWSVVLEICVDIVGYKEGQFWVGRVGMDWGIGMKY